MNGGTRFWTRSAFVDGAWRDDVELVAGPDGHWASIREGVALHEGAVDVGGPVIASLVDAHSHAFQRAMAGLAERREAGDDDFWSWRDRMYRVALRIAPAQLQAIAAWLYVELLRGGYTHVCEFHYLKRAPDGSDYGDPLAFAHALGEAAEAAGIGLTTLPVLYRRAGFAQQALRDDQRRFRLDADEAWRDSRALAATRRRFQHAGVAIHSLRAAAREDIARLVHLVGDADVPIHIHVAEQVREVEDCVDATGQRPIEGLCAAFPLDGRWHLVHATHATPAEIETVARTGASVVLCPGTEANLGDGLADLPGWLAAGVPWSIGSDSQVTRGWAGELRWLEYGQRLVRRQRNVAADPPHSPSTAARLFFGALRGGAAAAGLRTWGLVKGARADFLVLDEASDALIGVSRDYLLDAAVFSSPAAPFRDVYVGGRCAVRRHVHVDEARLREAFAHAVRVLA